MFGRVIDLEIQIKNQIKTYSNLQGLDNIKVEFNITKSINTAGGEATISIFGLLPDDIAFLSTNYIAGSGALNQSLISLIGGYKDNKTLLFNGNIVNANPNLTSKDYNIEIKAINAIMASTNSKSISLKNATLKSICQRLASDLGLILKYDNTINKTIGDYSYNGTAFSQILNLRSYYPNEIDIFINDGFLIIQKQKSLEKGKVFLLNSKTGLIGTPQPTATGCKIKSILNPALQVGGIIKLESKKIPQLNSFYKILELKHMGSNRTDMWVSEITALQVA